jgi:hypothetical protein
MTSGACPEEEQELDQLVCEMQRRLPCVTTRHLEESARAMVIEGECTVLKSTLAVALALGLIGCSADTSEPIVGALHSGVLGNDFTGNYVRVHAVRSVPADGKNPCLSELEVCLGLDPAGATAAVKDLCPSDDTPEGTWSFTYVVFFDAACTVPLANLGCMPIMQEWLHPGHNHNDVVCITRNAD